MTRRSERSTLSEAKDWHEVDIVLQCQLDETFTSPKVHGLNRALALVGFDLRREHLCDASRN